MANNKELADQFFDILHEMSQDLEPGEVVEIVESICIEQSNWVEYSVGWKVLEMFKAFVRVRELNKDWLKETESKVNQMTLEDIKNRIDEIK